MTPAKQFVERLKYAELKLLLEDYPLTKYFKETVFAPAPDGSYIHLPLAVDVLALALHYGIKTELMDVTTDKFVAAFFATTYCKDDIYTPITKKQKEKGVFYRYVDFLSLDSRDIRLKAVGLQPLSRPGEQRGLVYRMEPDEDFNELVKSIDYFEQDKDASEFIFNYTNRSKKLFPISALMEHINKIKASKIFSQKAFNIVLEEFYPGQNVEILKTYLTEESITITDDTVFSFSEGEKAKWIYEWENGGSQELLKQIIPRFTYTGPITIEDENCN